MTFVHYGDDTDEPLFTQTGTVKTREVEEVVPFAVELRGGGPVITRLRA